MEVNLHPSFCLLWAFLLLTVPLPWLVSAITAALFHELCHYWAIRTVHGQIYSLKLQCHGASMTISPLTAGKEWVCAMAGPAGSLLLFALFKIFPRLALCGGIQAAFNLLPIYPLDGGRMMRCAGCLFREKYLAKRRISEYNSATK